MPPPPARPPPTVPSHFRRPPKAQSQPQNVNDNDNDNDNNNDSDEAPQIQIVASIDTVPSNLIDEDENDNEGDAKSTEKSIKSFKSIRTFLSTKSNKSTHTTKTNPYALPPPYCDETKTVATVWDVVRGGKKKSKALSRNRALTRRLRDFNYAQHKRSSLYRNRETPTPLGIFGLYDYLSGVRRDVEWAEDAAFRRNNHLPYLTWKDHESGSTETSCATFSYFTYSLIAACCALMVWEFQVNDWVIESMSVNPMLGVSQNTLIYCGARVTNLIVNEGQGYRLLSAMFLHSGLIHLTFNMAVLLFIGRGLEKAHGLFETALIFLVGGFGGNVLSALFLPQYISVGASGGIFALLGATLADIIMNWNLLFSSDAIVRSDKQKKGHVWIIVVLVLDMVLNVLIGFLPFVDNFCHCGGLLIGFLLGMGTISQLSFDFFGLKRSACQRIKRFLTRAWSLILVAGILLAATVWLFQVDGYSSPCIHCRYVSCISMPFWRDLNDRWWWCDDCTQAHGMATFDEAQGGYYKIDLTCPSDKIVAVFPQNPKGTIEELNKILPTYCREHCKGFDAFSVSDTDWN
ncbi:hypothetical protein TL16_g10991, partial [Triparma laevis f. inornata]